MKRLLLLAMLSMPALAQNQWTMTCTDTNNRTSAATEVATSVDGCRSTVTGVTPTKRVGGSDLPFSAIDYCTVTRSRAGTVDATRLDPTMPTLKHVYVDRAACCTSTQPPVTPPTNPPAASTAKPMPPTNTRLSGTTISCTAPTKRTDGSVLTVSKYRLHRYNCTSRAKLASGLAQWSTCGGGYTGWRAGECYGVVAIDSAGKESGASPLVRAP